MHKSNHILPAIRGQGHPRNIGYIHVVEIESSMLHGKFHYYMILGCEVTDFKYVTVYER